MAREVEDRARSRLMRTTGEVVSRGQEKKNSPKRERNSLDLDMRWDINGMKTGHSKPKKCGRCEMTSECGVMALAPHTFTL